MSQVTKNDYLILTLIIFAMFTALLVLGNFGQLLRPVSPQTIEINRLYQFVYISASAVGSIFIGALFFMMYKFREKGE
ncbi:MAG: hypothetical protein QXD24_03195 [Candidatus Caldarchaeum sp.]